MPQNSSLPLAITMGEPAGIGPELVSRLWSNREALDLPNFIYVGAAEALLAVAPGLAINYLANLDTPPEADTDVLNVLDVPLSAPLHPGTLNSANGQAVISSIDLATRAALDGKVSGVITAPIHKAALYQAGFNAPGHTEYLARLCGLEDNQSVMMLATEGLRVVPVTVHIPLKDVASSLTADRIIHAGVVTAYDLTHRFGIRSPRLAVAGLNPHAGENGAFGMEEATHLMPAIWALRDQGIDVSDPQPADSLFHEEARAAYDAVLCMYHDQALIPLKTLDFWGGVNITLGLPIIRTSPDHGTALSLAGTGTCRLDSMIAAIKAADTMAKRSNT